jgi:pimeloyl-ACP methyl ester carboxylesterase
MRSYVTGFAETGVANAVLRVASKTTPPSSRWHGTRTEGIRIRIYQESVNQVIVRSAASSFRLAAILLLVNAIGANARAPTAQIDRVLFVPLGGIDQWISIRGENRANPVLLVVHGGPGEAQWPQAGVYRPWEKAFIVVQWDQRGAGHTFGRYGINTSDVTLDRISKDGVELAEYLCRELGKKKIIVLGHSWGSLVATRIEQMRPDLFAAYVGTGQVASWMAMVNIQYDLLLAKARKDGNQATVKELEAIGRPGPTNADHFNLLNKYNFRSLWAPSDQAWLQHLRSQADELKDREPEQFKNLEDGNAVYRRAGSARPDRHEPAEDSLLHPHRLLRHPGTGRRHHPHTGRR